MTSSFLPRATKMIRFAAVVGVAFWLGTGASGQIPRGLVRPAAGESAADSTGGGETPDREVQPEGTKDQPPTSQGKHALLDRVAENMLAGSAERLSKPLGKQARRRVLGIELWRYAYCLFFLILTFAASFALNRLLLRYAVRFAKRTDTAVDDMVFRDAVEPGRLAIHAVGVYVALMFLILGLELPSFVGRWFGRICLGTAAGCVFWYLYRIVAAVDHFLRGLAQRTDNDLDDTFVDVIRKTLRLFVVAVSVLFIGTYILDWDVTALLASAGIVGVAVAFAAQDTIANLFGTLMLLLDRPFRVGERIILEGADGPVESLGFRSTRIRTLDGNQVSIPNKSVANSKIENVGRRPHIKRVMTIGVTYDTPFEKMRKAVEIIRDVLKDHEGMDPEFPPRVHFTGFGAYSLDILAIAWYHPGEYWEYLAWCEEVNFEIMRRFGEEGIEFAFPTSTTYLAQDDRRPLSITTLSGRNSTAEDTSRDS